MLVSSFCFALAWFGCCFDLSSADRRAWVVGLCVIQHSACVLLLNLVAWSAFSAAMQSEMTSSDGHLFEPKQSLDTMTELPRPVVFCGPSVRRYMCSNVHLLPLWRWYYIYVFASSEKVGTCHACPVSSDRPLRWGNADQWWMAWWSLVLDHQWTSHLCFISFP